jgi:hypothetical protein
MRAQVFQAGEIGLCWEEEGIIARGATIPRVGSNTEGQAE